ncbi:MAG: hypothetical protein ISEC1_P0383 [Thiomicrorhabdus sp.]|nr:MAG: hypothetical protein ISEC1_P0383 [Thiomicrorhabdus sp.]
MNLNQQQLQLLNQLEDIQLPEPIGWWPLSSSWWMLIFMVSTVLIALIWYYFDQKRRNAYRKEALAILEKITSLNTFEGSPKNPNQQLLEINTLLKQVALTAYARADVAKLNNQDWLDFLKQTAGHINTPNTLAQSLQLAYQKPSEDDEHINTDLQLLRSFKVYAAAWIKGHHQ